MALASTIETNSGAISPTGIIVGLAPSSDPNAPLELWRAADSAGAPDTANAVMIFSGVVPPSGFNFFDQLAKTAATFWYRCRTNGAAYGPGPYTDWINLGAPDRVSADALNALMAGDSSQRSVAWDQQNARIGPQGNLLPNPGFEDGEAFWLFDTGVSTIITSSANARSGNKYLKVTSTTGVAAAVRACDDVGKSRYFEVNTNDVVQWGGYAYRESGTANVRYVLELTDKDKLNPTLFNTSNQNTAAWVLVQAQTIVGAGKKYARFWAEIDATGTGVVARFDDAYMRIALGAIYDTPPPNTLYEIRFANAVPDPDTVTGLQSFFDFVATTFFMRLGRTPIVLGATSSTDATPIVITAAGHGYSTGDTVTIRGHTTNTNANGTRTVTVLTTDTFSLDGSTATGAGAGSGGAAVKLALTIDNVGNLVVYAVVRAVQLIVNGAATFNGLITAAAGALFRNSLQHSTAGSYGDTTINRVMLRDNNVELRGDAGTGTDNLAALLGSHTVATSGTLTARASKDVGLTAGSKGWTDPDGVDDGINSLTQGRGTSNTVVAASRLWCKLGDPTAEGDNVDAYDDKYIVPFRVQVDFTDSGHDSECDATVVVEYSTNSGGAWTDAPGSYIVANLGTGTVTTVFTPTITVTGAPTHVWFRLKLSVTTAGLPGTPSGTGKVLCFSAAPYRTNNYAVTWTTSSGASKARRGLKLPATSDGTDQQPHAYLEPSSVVIPDANSAEGEVQFVAGTVHALAYRDDEKVRYVPKVIYIDGNQSVTNAAETLISSTTIKGGRLNVLNRGMRIRSTGRIGANTGTIKLYLGGALWASISLTSGQSWLFDYTLVTNTVGASGSLSIGGCKGQATTFTVDEGNFTMDLTADKLIEIKGISVGPVAITMRNLTVEWLF